MAQESLKIEHFDIKSGTFTISVFTYTQITVNLVAPFNSLPSSDSPALSYQCYRLQLQYT